MCLNRLLWMSCCASLIAACAAGSADVPAPPGTFELDRYLGRWHVIAQTGEAPAPDAALEYRRPQPGRIEARRYEEGRWRETTVWTVAEDGAWRTGGFWPFGGEARTILYVSADYRYALVGDPGRERAWVLAREPEMPEWVYAGLLARLAEQGYAVARLRRP